MTWEEAKGIAAEQIAFWISQGITEAEAWASLNRQPAWEIMWWEIRCVMVRWLLSQEADRTITKRAA